MATLRDREVLLKEVASLKSFGVEIPIDEAVANAFPPGVKASSAHPFGESAWSFSAKVNAIDADGNPVVYFLKYVPGELGKQQLEGEYVGMSALHKSTPHFVPKVAGWGKLKDVVPESHFLLLEYKEFTSSLPDPIKLAERVAAMHMNPDSVSPTGMFGFPIQTFDGARLQAVGWDSSWTSFFSKLLAEAYRQDTETNGIWPELDEVFRRVQSKLIPRLIGALEREGRSVTPVLLHGNMWDGNVGTESGTGDPWIFDCSAYYGHNEMELGIWRAERHKLRDKAYRQEYLQCVDPSEPEEEWDDRNRLYSAKTNFMHSACYQGSEARRLAFNDFTYLLNKYESEYEVDGNWDEGANVTTEASQQDASDAQERDPQHKTKEQSHDESVQQAPAV